MRQPNLYQEALFQGRLWSPAVLRPDFWFDAADASTVTTVSGNVSQWNDKSGNGRNMSEATNRPAYSIEQRNGLNTITYGTGSTQSLTVTGLSIAYTEQSSFAAARPNGSDFNGRLWTQSDSLDDWQTTNNYIPINKGQTGNQWGSNTGTLRSIYNIVEGDWAILSSHRNASQVQNFYKTVGASAFSQAWAGKTFERFGATANIGGLPFKYAGEIGEIIVLNFYTETRDRQLVEGYLSWKWALPLPADHPFVNRPPLIGD